MTSAQIIRVMYLVSTVPLYVMTLAVLKRYYDIWVEKRRLLPHHVWLIATSYTFYVTSSVVRVIGWWDQPVSRLLFNDVFGSVTGIFALWFIIGHLRETEQMRDESSSEARGRTSTAKLGEQGSNLH